MRLNYQRILGTALLVSCLGLCSFGQNNMVSKIQEIGFPTTNAFSADASAILSTTPTTHSEDIVSAGSHYNPNDSVFQNVVAYQDSTYDEGRHHKIYFPLPPNLKFDQFGTAVSNGPFGNYWVGHSMIANGVEYAYLVKVDPSGTPLYAHVYGPGRIKEIEYHVQSNAMIVYGHNSSGNLFIMSLDPNPGSTLTNDYNWGWELESFSNDEHADQVAHDLAIEPNDGEIVLQATSIDQVTNDQDVSVWRFRSDGVLQWQYEYGQTTTHEQARGICIGPGNIAGPPYNLVMIMNRGANMVSAQLDPNNGNVLNQPLLYSNPNGVRLQPQDIEFSSVNNQYYVCGLARNGGNRDGMVVPLAVTMAPVTTTFHSFGTNYSPVNQSATFVFNKVMPEPSGNVCFSGSAYHNNSGGFAGGYWLLRTNAAGQDPTMCSATPLIDAVPYVLPRETKILWWPKNITIEPSINGGPVDILQGSTCSGYAYKDAADNMRQTTPQESSDMVVFPNPASAQAQVLFPGAPSEPWQVQLHDVTGRAAGPITIASNGVVQLELNDLPSGLYFVRATNGSTSMVKRLIIE